MGERDSEGAYLSCAARKTELGQGSQIQLKTRSDSHRLEMAWGTLEVFNEGGYGVCLDGMENMVQRKLRHQARHQADPPLISLLPLNCQLLQGASPEALEDSEAWLPEPLPCLAPGTPDTSVTSAQSSQGEAWFAQDLALRIPGCAGLPNRHGAPAPGEQTGLSTYCRPPGVHQRRTARTPSSSPEAGGAAHRHLSFPRTGLRKTPVLF